MAGESFGNVTATHSVYISLVVYTHFRKKIPIAQPINYNKYGGGFPV